MNPNELIRALALGAMGGGLVYPHGAAPGAGGGYVLGQQMMPGARFFGAQGFGMPGHSAMIGGSGPAMLSQLARQQASLSRPLVGNARSMFG